MQVTPYLKYYLGWGFRVWYKDGTIEDDCIINLLDSENGVFGFRNDVYFFTPDFKDFKLILKDPADMLVKERKQYKELCKKILDSSGKLLHIVDTPQSLHYAICKGYDMFGLIESGLAIDELLKNKI